MIQYKSVNGHVEVYRNGQFVLSADTIAEAYEEMNKQ